MSNSEQDRIKRVEKELDSVDHSKRETLRKMITGAAYVAPVVTSFAVDRMAFGPALATVSNSS